LNDADAAAEAVGASVVLHWQAQHSFVLADAPAIAGETGSDDAEPVAALEQGGDS
jgi:hypothetical protein